MKQSFFIRLFVVLVSMSAWACGTAPKSSSKTASNSKASPERGIASTKSGFKSSRIQLPVLGPVTEEWLKQTPEEKQLAIEGIRPHRTACREHQDNAACLHVATFEEKRGNSWGALAAYKKACLNGSSGGCQWISRFEANRGNYKIALDFHEKERSSLQDKCGGGNDFVCRFLSTTEERYEKRKATLLQQIEKGSD